MRYDHESASSCRQLMIYQVKYRGNAIEHKDKAQDIADFIVGYRPEATARNMENDVSLHCVSGLVYCRSRGAVSGIIYPQIIANPGH